jgi:hypothetical protein
MFVVRFVIVFTFMMIVYANIYGMTEWGVPIIPLTITYLYFARLILTRQLIKETTSENGLREAHWYKIFY